MSISNKQKITRIFNDKDGNTHFEDYEVELGNKTALGFLSDEVPVKGMKFRVTTGEYDDTHCAPRKQYIIMLDGKVSVTTSLGVERIFKTGDILLAEDVEGKGHRSKAVNNEPRKSLFVWV